MLCSVGPIMTRPTAMVAGAGGFIGRHVSDALRADGDDVIEVGRGTAHAHLAADRLPPAAADLSLAVFAAGASSVGQSLDAPSRTRISDCSNRCARQLSMQRRMKAA